MYHLQKKYNVGCFREYICEKKTTLPVEGTTASLSNGKLQRSEFLKFSLEASKAAPPLHFFPPSLTVSPSLVFLSLSFRV